MLDYNLFYITERHFLQQCVLHYRNLSICPPCSPGTAHVALTGPDGSDLHPFLRI